MKKLYNKIRITILSILGCWVKVYLNFFFEKNYEYGVNTIEKRNKKVIVSLTSYGRRVQDILPYTLRSLLRQNYKPDAVILWLDDINWNSDNIPKKLKILQRQGLTIRFCKDIKSYKKHIFALAEFPDDIIITTDDDFYYSRDFIKRLVEAYEKDPNRVYTHRAHRPVFSNGTIMPYDKWEKLVYNKTSYPLFPTTGGGCMFQKRLLYHDVLKEELFMKLCPTADDVWFYFMIILQHIPITVLPFKEFTMIPLDTFYQLSHRNSSLQHQNRGRLSMNDKQIKQMMDHYHLTCKNLV